MESDWMFLPHPQRNDSGYASFPKNDNALVKGIRAKVMEYRLQSPLHFALHIDIQARDEADFAHVQQGGRCKVALQAWGQCIICIGRFLVRKGRVTERIQIRHNIHGKKKWVPVMDCLLKHFPVENANADTDTLRGFWDRNGSSFNWTGLPTELKEQILQYCIFQDRRNPMDLVTVKKHRPLPRVPHEIQTLLGRWSALLGVSRQVRVLVLRLLFRGNLHFKGGLALVASNDYMAFRSAIIRLGEFYQMMEPNGLPKDDRSKRLAHRYLYQPQDYPKLSQYATMVHGICKLSLEFGFLYSLYFFKVSVGHMDKYRPRKLVTCDVFERLPHLKTVHIVLPREWYYHSPTATMLNFWHSEDPCPRIISRWIYERASEVLAPYEDIRVFPFMDGDEAMNFHNLRTGFRLSWISKEEKRREFYDDEDGGVDLIDYIDYLKDKIPESSDPPSSGLYGVNATTSEASRTDNESDSVEMPPRCRCSIPCTELFAMIGRDGY